MNTDLPEPLRQGVRFSCTQCGACCTGAPGRVQVSEAELGAIAELLGEDVDELRKRATRVDEDGLTLRERENGDCLFFIEQRCSIHSVKPAQCALYPFWFQNVRSPEAWQRTVAECEGIGQGDLVSPEEIRNQVQKDLLRLKSR